MFIVLLIRPHRSSLSRYYVDIYCKSVLHAGYKVSQGRPYLVSCSQLQPFVSSVHAGRQEDLRPIRRDPLSVTQVDQLRLSRQRRGHHGIHAYRWTENCACLLNVLRSYHIEFSRRANSCHCQSVPAYKISPQAGCTLWCLRGFPQSLTNGGIVCQVRPWLRPSTTF